MGYGQRGAHDRRSSHASTKGGRQWPVPRGMTIDEVVRKALREEHGDVIRESVRLWRRR